MSIYHFVRYFNPETELVHFGIREGHSVIRLLVEPWKRVEPVGVPIPLEQVTIKPPTAPSKVVCIGLNYHAHVAASQSADKPPDYPLIFLKPPSAVIGNGDEIVHPRISRRVDFEAELGVIIGKTACDVPLDRAEEYIFGYTCVNDVTARDLQKKDGQWSRAKGFDTFCPVGPSIVNGIGWRDLTIEGLVNDEVRQTGNTNQMIFSVPHIVSYVSSIMTLNPGDLISTGTPEGLCTFVPGETVEVRISRIGSLVNPMVSAD